MHSTRRQVSVETLLDWTLRYRRNGLAALSPKPRKDRGQTRAVAFLDCLRQAIAARPPNKRGKTSTDPQREFENGADEYRDPLHEMERRHVLSQFEEARGIYERLVRETE